MPSIHGVFKDDDPNVPASNIIGGGGREGRLYYEGRPQSQKLWAETEEELIESLKARQSEIVHECRHVIDSIYPDRASWAIRIFYP